MYRSSSIGGNKTLVGTYSSGTTSIIDTNPPAGVNCYYWVVSMSSIGDSEYSDHTVGVAYEEPVMYTYASRNDNHYPNYTLGDTANLTITTSPAQPFAKVYNWRMKGGEWERTAKEIGTTDANGRYEVDVELPTDLTELCGSYSNERYAVGSTSNPQSSAMAYTITCP